MTTATSTVRDLMTPNPICVDPAMSLRELARALGENEVSGAPVVDGGSRVIGVVSKTDIINSCLEGHHDVPPGAFFEMLAEDGEGLEDMHQETTISVQDIMSDEPITASPDEPVSAVARRLGEAGVHRAVVVDDQQCPIGIVTSLDLLRAFPA